DIQNDYFPGGLQPLVGVESASQSAAAALQRFRDCDEPVIHIRHVFADASAPFFRPETDGVEIHASVTPDKGETIVTKQFVNAFRDTELERLLQSLRADRLVIAGAMSHMCVEGTTRAAADLGFGCQVIQDACATCDQRFGEQIVAATDVHATAMSTLGFAYAEVLSLGEWLNRS
ncbi:MAG: cysteine hydrolase family protein, partial [Planctomycetota bacterium]